MADGLRVIVCGGRSYHDRETVFDALDQAERERGLFRVIIEGGASGADKLAREWAQCHSVPVITVPAEWRNIKVPGAVIAHDDFGRPYNKAAGLMRNQRMLDECEPDLVIAFPGGRGTASMISLAKKAGVEVLPVGDE